LSQEQNVTLNLQKNSPTHIEHQTSVYKGRASSLYFLCQKELSHPYNQSLVRDC